MARTITSFERSRKLRVMSLSLIAIVAILSVTVVIHIVRANPVVYTDKANYSPEEIVTIFGYGFSPSANVTFSVIRSNGEVNTCDDIPTRLSPCPLTADSSGSFTAYYQLDGTTGLYFVLATDGGNSATTTFLDDRASSTSVTCGSSTVNTPTTCTATVTDTAGAGGASSPTGTVSSKLDSSSIGSCSLSFVSSSSSHCSITFTPGSGSAGSHTITASYSGDHKPSSGSITLTVNPADTTPPVIVPTVTPPPNVNGWEKGSVTVTWSVSDPESGISSSSGCGTTTLTTETSGTTLTCSATNGAGLSSSSSVTVKIDLTLPTITGSKTPGPNINGWNNGPVTASFSCSDPLSGVSSVSGSSVLTSEGASQSATGSCTDNAGNSASTTVAGINIDLTSPSVSGSRSPGPNSFGWNNSPVTASFACSDSLSGVASVSGPVTVSSDGSSQSATGTCTDKAGNTASTSVTGINIDQTSPTLTASRSPSPNSNGWNNADVTVSFTCTDSLSGVNAGPTSPQVVSTEGANQARSATCTDKAGNSVTTTLNGISIDKTPPAISGSKSPAPNSNDWNNGAVTVSFTCTDALSGVATTPSSQLVSTEGSGQSRTGICTDNAGNTASATIGDINIDLTPPAITGSRSAPPNGNGWNNAPVTISFTCTDAFSGISSVSSPTTLGERSGQSVAGTCADKAGNSASTAESGINIDLTPPTITGSRSPDANANGWNNAPVMVGFDCSDSLSGVLNLSAPKTIGEGESQSATGACIDLAGNSATVSETGINVDLTPPSITGSRSPGPNANSWNNGSVTVSFSCADPLSGVESCSSPTNLSGEGAGQHVTGYVTDLAGNTASVSVSNVNIDETPPSIIGSKSPGPNTNGWNNEDVLVTFSCSDGLSGVDVSPISPQVVSSEGAGQSRTGTCVDEAGNSASASVSDINIDKTPSSITGSRSPTANANDWTNTPVTVTFVCVDWLSGVEDSSPPTILGEGASQSMIGTCIDKAGNSASTTVADINVDLTSPVVTSSRSIAPNANDWYKVPVTVSFDCSDPLSGVEKVSAPITLAEGGSQSATGACMDLAGNSVTTTETGINIDLTQPTITASRSIGANVHGWNDVPVTVSFSCSDSISGVFSVSPRITLGEGVWQSVSGICFDLAGNSVSTTLGNINVDLTPPVIEGSRTPAAKANGWNNADVTVAFTCSDALSGVDSYSSPSVLGEGAVQSVTGVCEDNAGNSASTIVAGINVDLTAPIVTTSRSPGPNVNGWNNVPVTVSFYCTDGLSGVAIVSPSVTLGEGSTQSAMGTCVDLAGNAASVTQSGVNVDLRAPVIIGSRSPDTNSFGWNDASVTVSFACSDILSGVSALTPPTVLSVGGASQFVTGTCLDLAGNSAVATVSGINIDLTKPIITSHRSVLSNSNGWSNVPVTVSFTCTDALSGVSLVSGSSILGEGASQFVTGVCNDKAGNIASGTESEVNIDLTAPVINSYRSMPPNGYGWNNVPVTVSFTCYDSLSGAFSLSSPVTFGEGANQTGIGTCVDRAGNSASTSNNNINIDLTSPIIAASRSLQANSFGWNNLPVTVSYACTDSLSRVASLSAPTTLSGDGASQSTTGLCTDKAGNSASTTIGNINIDQTSPVVVGHRSVTPNIYAWNNVPVTVSFTCTDALSGVNSASGPTTLGEGASQSVAGACTDKADNSATTAEGDVNIDLTPPIISGSRSPTTNSYGWNNGDVVVSFSCSDSLSGVAVPSVTPQTVTSEGFGQSRSSTCTDKAGNSATATVSGISIDKTIPSLSWSRTPLANVFGWNNVSVTVSFACYDSLSGVDSYSSPSTLSAEGAGQSVSGNCIDKAGNMSSFSVGGGINIDKTRPQTSISIGNPKFITGGTTQVSLTTTFTLASTDNLSGIYQTKYSIDNPAALGLYSGPFVVPSKGPHTIYFESIDRALNVETIHSLSVVVGTTTLTYVGNTQGTYSDPAAVKAVLVEVASQKPIASKPVSFTLGGQSATATTNSTGFANTIIILSQNSGNYMVTSSFPGDSSFQPSAITASFTILKKNSSLTYTGDTVVSTGAKSITLAATIQETQDGYLGNLTRARTTFRIYASDNSQTLLSTVGPVAVVSTSNPGVGTVTVQIANMQENTYLIVFSLDPESNLYYSAPSTEPVVLTVYQPNGSYATGGGWIVDSSGSHGNFGFVVHYNSAGNVQGHAVYIYRVGGLDYMIKSNAWIGMAIVGTHAYFQGKATLQVMDPTTGALLYSVGNYQFRVDVYDNTGATVNNGVDTYQITVWDNNGLVYHQATGSLMGGQIMIHGSKPQ